MQDLGNNVAGFKNRILGDGEPTYQRIDPASLKPASRLAISAFEMEKAGLLEVFPYVRINPKGRNRNNTTDYSSFIQRNVVVLHFEETPDGSYCQDMLCESMDSQGRIDLSKNRIVFKVRQPDTQEAIMLAQSLVVASKAVKTSDAEVRRNFKTAVSEYQKANGLAPDGSLGTNTVKSLSQTISILDVRELTSQIYYPAEPKSVLYVLPYDLVTSAPERFNKGYASLDAVKQHALSTEDFKKEAVPDGKFVLFLYFLDRVNPDKAIRMCISASENRWTKGLSPMKYALPGVWPVITEILSIDEALEPSRLYINVFTKGKYMYNCIASHRIM